MLQLTLILVVLLGVIPLMLGMVAVAFWGRRNADLPPALLFHSVPLQANWALSSIDKAQFSGFMDGLHQHGWQSVTVRDYTALVEKKQPLPDHSFVLTFDDAYEDVYLNALPILTQCNFKATIFVISSYIGRQADWDVYTPQRHMSVAQIRAAHALGHEIGSHTVTHANLPFLSTVEVLRELRDSRHALEDLLGCAVTSVSFPFGSWNERIWQCARDAGYVAATIYRGAPRVQERMLIPVQGVYRVDTLDDLICKLTGGGACRGAFVRTRILPHFAKGSAIWKDRLNYGVWRELFDRNVS